MAANPSKTKMINRMFLKLGGVTDTGTLVIATIDDTVFANPTTAESDGTKAACILYPDVLQQAIKDMQPKFATRYADLGTEIKITLDGANGTPFERADWERIFELPSDYLALLFQLDEANKATKYEADEIAVHSYAHVVKGTDDQAYYCILDHTSAAANKPITGASYATNWSLFDADVNFGATWESGHAYKSDQTGKLLLAKEYSNVDGDSAYIKYLAYAVTGVGDQPLLYDQPFIEAFTTLFASEMAPWSQEHNRRLTFRNEYERLAKPTMQRLQNRPDFEEPVETWLAGRQTG